MNLGKGAIGGGYLFVVLLFVGFEPMGLWDFLLLGFSGLIGIALGDTFFFISLMYLGPRLAALMGTLTPVCITFAAVMFLGERPAFLAWLGIVLTISGITWVLRERLPQNALIKNKPLGVWFSLLAVACTTIGVIFAKMALTTVSAMQAVFIRIIWGAVGLAAWGILKGRLRDWVIPFKNLQILRTVSYINLVVIFGGFWLSLVSLKYIDASIASTLSSTTPIFILPMVALMLKEKVPARAIWGALLAVGGVALIFLGK